MGSLRVCYIAFLTLTAVSSMHTKSSDEKANDSFYSDSSTTGNCYCEEDTGITDCRNARLKTTPLVTCEIANVLRLDLSQNNITVLNNGSFKTLTTLQTLIIQNSQVKLVHMKAFENLGQLVHLDLSFNNIEQLHSETFRKLENLQVLHFQNNPLRVLENTIFASLKHIKILDFINCELNSFSKNVFMKEDSSAVEESASDSSYDSEAWPSGVFINLLGNPLNCNCDMIDFYEFIKVSKNLFLNYNKLTCMEPTDLRDTLLFDLESADFRCKPFEILHPPRQTTVTTTSGDDITLTCRVTNDPQFPWERRWIFDSERLTNTTTETHGPGRYVLSRSNKWINLTIENVRKSDKGIYRCEVFNRSEKIHVYRSVSLVVFDRTEQDVPLDFTVAKGRVTLLVVLAVLFSTLAMSLVFVVHLCTRGSRECPKKTLREKLNFMVPVSFYQPSDEMISKRPLPKRPGSEVPACYECSDHYYEEVSDRSHLASNPCYQNTRDTKQQQRQEGNYDSDHYFRPATIY